MSTPQAAHRKDVYYASLSRKDFEVASILPSYQEWKRNEQFQIWFKTYKQELYDLFHIFQTNLSTLDYNENELSFQQFATVIYRNSSGRVVRQKQDISLDDFAAEKIESDVKENIEILDYKVHGLDVNNLRPKNRR
jgi:hypothetical protein